MHERGRTFCFASMERKVQNQEERRKRQREGRGRRRKGQTAQPSAENK